MGHIIKCILIVILGMGVMLSVSSAATLKPHEHQNDFIPHKALYDITLKSVSSGSQIANISGQMYYEWTVECDAWTSEHRFNLLYEYADEPAMRITSDFSTYESFDGKNLNFVSQRKQDGRLFEEIRGQAMLDDDAEGQAVFNTPKDLVYALPAETKFPMAHSQFIIDAIRDGKKFASTTLFDGSDDEGPVQVNAIIGKSVLPQSKLQAANFQRLPEAARDLLGSPAHQINLAFFPLNDPEDTPDYEIALILHENSVISDMDIDYGEFSVHQTLIALEPIENACVTAE